MSAGRASSNSARSPFFASGASHSPKSSGCKVTGNYEQIAAKIVLQVRLRKSP
ncbi:hypothetical protein [Limnoglobus roseus]|uniref:hypothetical protein n=1 Tax=Limnoglobus roseus TaxID=2598579 RepID=UPI00143DDB3F|nr:hypothetical protein [Limnoglobus roseus]